jgi:hypothetical protein
MASHPRSMLQIAIAATTTAVLWTAVPAMAAENTTPGDATTHAQPIAPVEQTAPVQQTAPAQQSAAPAPAAVPGQAAPAQTAATPAATPARTAPSVVKRDTPRPRRVASSSSSFYRAPTVAPIRTSYECSGFWCGGRQGGGQQYVMMILGVGF